jgi:putative DNA primase/helicase
MTTPKTTEELCKEFAKNSEKYSTRKNLLGVAASHAEARIDQLDCDLFLLNVENGTIDLRTGKLRPHRADDFITKLAPIKFDPDAPCPRFEAFLWQIFNGDQELIRFLQKALGYALTGEVTEQVFFLLFGTGANGKSTLMELLALGLGDYALAAPPGLLLAKKWEGHPTDLADLFGARMVITSEVKTDACWDEERIKRLTGGDTIKARRMREDFWSFQPTHKIFLSTNHKPATNDSSIGFWRRVRMIPFTVTIPEDKRDPDLLNKLKKELPGILAWAVRGCLMWQKEGLGSCAAVDKATAAYRAESDQIASFVEECCQLGHLFESQAQLLYRAYLDWANARKEPAFSIKLFGTRLREMGFTPTKSSATYYQGLRIKSDPVS